MKKEFVFKAVSGDSRSSLNLTSVKTEAETIEEAIDLVAREIESKRITRRVTLTAVIDASTEEVIKEIIDDLLFDMTSVRGVKHVLIQEEVETKSEKDEEVEVMPFVYSETSEPSESSDDETDEDSDDDDDDDDDDETDEDSEPFEALSQTPTEMVVDPMRLTRFDEYMQMNVKSLRTLVIQNKMSNYTYWTKERMAKELAKLHEIKEMSVKTLRELAKELDLKSTSTLTKEELVAVIHKFMSKSDLTLYVPGEGHVYFEKTKREEQPLPMMTSTPRPEEPVRRNSAFETRVSEIREKQQSRKEKELSNDLLDVISKVNSRKKNN